MSSGGFREAQRGDLAATVELLRAAFPGVSKFSRAFLDWQYYDNPAGAPLGVVPARAHFPII